MDRPLHAACRGRAGERLRIVRAAQLDDGARRVLHDALAFQDVGIPQAHLAARRQPEELLRRRLHEVVVLDVEHARERDAAGPGGRVLRVVDRVDVLDAPFRIVLDDDLERPQHRERAQRAAVEILAHGVLEQRDVDDVLFLGDADARAEVAHRFRRVAAPADAGNRRHARVVPPRHDLLLHERQQLPLAHDRVVQVQAGELDLLRARPELARGARQRVDAPVVQRPVILELQRAERVRDAFDRVRQRMRVVVGRIDAPGVAGAVMRRVADAVQRRVAHVDVRRRHVDLRAQHVRAVGKLARAHPVEQVEVLRHRPVAIRAVGARFRQRPAVRADLVGAETVHVRLAVANELLRVRVQQLEVVGRVQHRRPLEPEPSHVCLDRLDVLDVFLGGVGVVEAEVAAAAELAGHAEVEADRLGVADVEVPVRLGRKAGVHTAAVPSVACVFRHDFAHEIERCRRRRCPGVKLHPTIICFELLLAAACCPLAASARRARRLRPSRRRAVPSAPFA